MTLLNFKSSVSNRHVTKFQFPSSFFAFILCPFRWCSHWRTIRPIESNAIHFVLIFFSLPFLLLLLLRDSKKFFLSKIVCFISVVSPKETFPSLKLIHVANCLINSSKNLFLMKCACVCPLSSTFFFVYSFVFYALPIFIV